MKPSVRALLLACSAASLITCGNKRPPPERAVVLEGNAVARVADEEVAADTVAAIASQQNVDVRRALDLAVFDALVAAEAKARGLDERERRHTRTALAEVLLRQLADEARAEGDPSEAEIEELTAANWYEVARPEAIAVVHAVVRVDPNEDALVVAKAEAVAQSIRAAILPTANAAKSHAGPDYLPRPGIPVANDPEREDFLRLAKATPSDGLPVAAELIPAFAADTYSVHYESRAPNYDPGFVRQAFKLQNRGDVSPVIRTPFGFHVIMLLGRSPGSMLSLQARRQLFTPLVILSRTRKRIDEIVGRMRQSTKIVEERNVDAVLEQVQVVP